MDEFSRFSKLRKVNLWYMRRKGYLGSELNTSELLGSSRGQVVHFPLRVDFSSYLQSFIAFKHIGVLCSSFPSTLVIRSSRFLTGFYGRERK